MLGVVDQDRVVQKHLATLLESKLTFTMSGGDAGEAMAAEQRLFETQFEEANEAAPKAGG